MFRELPSFDDVSPVEVLILTREEYMAIIGRFVTQLARDGFQVVNESKNWVIIMRRV
jgi:hypothetical protein